ncbi:SDR family NAD(P)-dependent oxidoreductase [Variovorax sp. Sphag1AA]|uniref:SDR family NAD(P)-dependent oxidoreductase n=1 Tax=Variovorax sp. Sphag1AA TaxID=2587027 RepID=UPI001620B8F2|nr:SDR family oxidoreductase [Variovorax sp. Sphag1AA]MBB3181067.1 3-oxoacyl-[acyl-carrier protein] reductase [Variovorax sp. Sphag1AA]
MTETTQPTAPIDTRPSDWMRRSTIEGFAALIVGGGSGMGAACARTFAANGGLVVVADLRGENAERVASEVVANGGKAIAIAMDVSNPQDIDRAVKATVEAYGRLDVLINAATWSQNALLEEVDMADWANAFQTNVHGPLLLARACLPYLRKSPAPAIVHVASLAGVVGYARKSAYGPTKAALITMSRQMALEWAVDNIRVNVVIPGTIDSPLARKMIKPEVLADRHRQIPLGRLGLPSEMADLAVFLASPAASFITGQAINCCGGFSINSFVVPAGMTETLREVRQREASES